MSDIHIRGYTPEDQNACLAIFDSNMPKFFTADERDEFKGFLKSQALEGLYLVVEDGTSVVACGGLELDIPSRTAGLVWGMVVGQKHGKGIGRILTEKRLETARQRTEVSRVVIDTSQHSKGFYERLGFVVTGITENGYGPGLDQYDMALSL